MKTPTVPESPHLIEAKERVKALAKQLAVVEAADAQLLARIPKWEANLSALRAKWEAEDEAVTAALDRGDLAPPCTPDVVRAEQEQQLKDKIHDAIVRLYGDRQSYLLLQETKRKGLDATNYHTPQDRRQLERDLAEAKATLNRFEREHRDACRLAPAADHVAALAVMCAELESAELQFRDFCVSRSGAQITVTFPIKQAANAAE